MRKLQKGMWVKSKEGKVGVLFQNDITNVIEFHLVGDDGTTTLILPIVGEPEAAGYLQAVHSDIPKSRQPLTEVSRTLGYIR